MSKSARGERQTSTMDHDTQQQQPPPPPQQQQKERAQTKSETENGPQQRSSSEKKTSGASSPRCKKKQQPQQQRSPNKIYRAPPTPEPEELHVKERSFVLDSVAVNTTINDHPARPKLGKVRL